MPFRIKVSLVVLALLATVVFVVPLVVPIPPPPGVKPLAELTAGATMVEVNGVKLRVLEREPDAAVGEQLTFVLLHDYALNADSFTDLTPLLARHGRVVAFDRPGYGLSERPLPANRSEKANEGPYAPSAQVTSTLGVMDALGVADAVLVGNGTGGHVALEVASSHPDRVRGLVLLDTPSPEATDRAAPNWLLNSPQMQRIGPVFLRQLEEGPGEQLLTNAFYDLKNFTDEMREARALNMAVEEWDKALWQISRAGRPKLTLGELRDMSTPTLIVAGVSSDGEPQIPDDGLAPHLANAELSRLTECGRVPQLECPEQLDSVLSGWLTAAELTGKR